QTVDGAKARAEVVFLKWTYRIRARIVQPPCLEIECGGLAVALGGWKVQRVSQPRVDREAVGDFPVVLNGVLMKMRAFLNFRLLEVDGKGLHLSKQEARECVAGVRDPR